MIVYVTLERDAKNRWGIVFSGPKGGGALKLSKTLQAALKQLTKALLKEFPDPKPDPKSDLLIPPQIIIDTGDPESPFDFPTETIDPR